MAGHVIYMDCGWSGGELPIIEKKDSDGDRCDYLWGYMTREAAEKARLNPQVKAFRLVEVE